MVVGCGGGPGVVGWGLVVLGPEGLRSGVGWDPKGGGLSGRSRGPSSKSF